MCAGFCIAFLSSEIGSDEAVRAHPTDLPIPLVAGAMAPRLSEQSNRRPQRMAAQKNNNKIFLQTRLCKFFMLGKCHRGEDCSFAHGSEQLKPQPNFYHTQLCVDFARSGTCAAGRRCNYAHGAEELRAVHMGPELGRAVDAGLEQGHNGAVCGLPPSPKKGVELSISRQVRAVSGGPLLEHLRV